MPKYVSVVQKPQQGDKNRPNLLWRSFPNTSLDGIIKVLETVGILLDTVDTHKPVLGGIGLLQVVQFDVLVAYLYVTRPVKSRRSAEIQLWHQQSTTLNKDMKRNMLSEICMLLIQHLEPFLYSSIIITIRIIIVKTSDPRLHIIERYASTTDTN